MTAVHAVHVGTSPAQDRKRLRLVRRVYFAVGLVVVISVSIFAYAYYSLGASSVSGVSFLMVLANRSFPGGTFPNRNVTFFIELQIYSPGAVLEVSTGPSFLVLASSLSLGNASFLTSRLPSGGELTYNLRFSLNESTNAGILSYSGSDLDIYLRGNASSGLYSGIISERAAYSWNWTTSTGFREFIEPYPCLGPCN